MVALCCGLEAKSCVVSERSLYTSLECSDGHHQGD